MSHPLRWHPNRVSGALTGKKICYIIWSVGGEERPIINRIRQRIRFIKKLITIAMVLKEHH